MTESIDINMFSSCKGEFKQSEYFTCMVPLSLSQNLLFDGDITPEGSTAT